MFGIRSLLRNAITLMGAVIVTMSALLFLIIFFLDLFGFHSNPYLGIFFFLIVPAIFVVGLLLIPLGMWRERRARAAGHPAKLHWPRLDLNDPIQRRATFIFLLMTLANVVIVSLAAYKGIEFMDSPSFCGDVCHDVMEPEYTAFRDGPHSRVGCVQCHIGPGASWFVKSKLDGVRQVAAVLLDSHSRPIPSPVHNLRPARETCEQCHWPEKFHGDNVKVIREYADDKEVTETITTLRIHVGGGSEKTGTATGIHWHMNIANEIDYIATDDKRQEIGYVRLRDRYGNVREYFADGVTEEQLARGERRRMDCMDCHNRPSHPFAPTPERAVDDAIGAGEIPRSLPFIRREAVAAVKITTTDKAAALQEIADRLTSFYQSTDNGEPINRADIDRAVQVTQRLYARNVFPEMKVQWGSYPNNIEHNNTPGCFRCHTDTHKTKAGRTISQDCELCHTIE
jgi:hypothetical protein